MKWSQSNYDSYSPSGWGHAAPIEASRGFVIAAIVLVTVAFVVPLGESWQRSTYDLYGDAASTEDGARDGSMARQLGMLAIAGFGIASLIMPGGKRVRPDGVLGALCLAFLVWCALTCGWAADPMLSFKRWIVLMCESLAGLGIAKRVSARQFAWMALACCSAWLGLGLLAELSHGTFRPWQSTYRLAGIFHPNQMGINCAMLSMSAFYLGKGGRGGNRMLMAVAAFGFVMLYLTQSRTAMAALILSIVALWLLMTPAVTFIMRSLAAVTLAAAVTIAVGFGLLDVGQESLAMGRADHDPTSLTGRVPLWEELLGYVQYRPLVGYGFNSFWTSERIAEISHSQEWLLSSAHNTYIDLLLNIGLIGTALCLSAMVLVCFRATRLEQQLPNSGYGFIAMLVICGLAAGLLETTIGYTWYMSFFGICGVAFLAMCEDPALRPLANPARPRQLPSFGRRGATA